MRGTLVTVVGFVLLLLLTATLRVACVASEQVEAGAPSAVAIDAEKAAERLALAVRERTVSTGPGGANCAGLVAAFAAGYPRAHEVLEREAIGERGWLYTWAGRDAALAPVLLLAHLDVVPAGDAGAWTHPPFDGVIADGFVWGRGSLDDKLGAVATLEAVEALATAGFTPARTVCIAFGADEEVGGEAGARVIAEELARRGLRFAWVLDEGLCVVEDALPGVDAPAGLVGIAEKGYLTVQLVARAKGGHSSMPPADTATARLSRALARIEAEPFPAAVDGPALAMFDALVPELPLARRIPLGNLWLFEPLVLDMLLAEPAPAATVRTTVAVTRLEAGVKDNVLPTEARATLNLRLHPRDSIDGAILALERRIAGTGVVVERSNTGFSSEPSPVSDPEGPGFVAIARSIRAVWPDVLVAPGLVIGGTDSRWYRDVADDVYRFLPVRLSSDDLPRVHGIDERIPIEGVADAARFYATLLSNLDER